MKRGSLGMLIAWVVIHVLAALLGDRRDAHAAERPSPPSRFASPDAGEPGALR
jgi:hypothetical protein